MNSIFKLWLMSAIVTSGYWFSHPTQAQVVPDDTTPTTEITGDCLAQCDITGGVRAESNLFHSFREFNIGIGESLYFVDPGVANIFSRVTGNNGSEILGNLGVTGDANLWLINPQGIILGNGATLDVKGSFVATTADEIVFGDRGFFSANPDSQENLPLLTVNPSAFFYRQMEQNRPITVEGASLAVPVQENIVLLGAQNSESIPGVSLQEANISAPQGNIQIGAAATDGIIKIDPDFQLEFPEDITKGDITVARGSIIESSGNGGGSINIQGGELNVTGNSQILSRTLGNIDGEDISINTQKLIVQDGSLISTLTSGAGTGGNITIEAEESIELLRTPANSILPTAIFTNSVSPNSGDDTSPNSGDAGNLNISTKTLIIQDGSQISSTSGLLTGEEEVLPSGGAGGDIKIHTDESVTISGSSANGIFPSSIISSTGINSNKPAGNITIDTSRFIFEDQALISASSAGSGDGGDIEINASESMQISGSQETLAALIAASSSGVGIEDIDLTLVRGALLTITNGGEGGNIKLTTPVLNLDNGSLISTISLGSGNGGNIEIETSQKVEVSNSLITTATLDLENAEDLNGNAGDLNIDTNQLIVNNGIITTAATSGLAKAGNINIDTDFLIAFPNSSITATAFEGQGGNIDIKAQELFIASSSQIDASSQLGIDGKVNIERFNNNLRNNLTKLPETPLENSNRIVSRCGAGNELAQNSFVYTGKGALPPSPLDGNFYSDEFLVDWGTETSEFELHQVHQSPNTEIVEATGWIVSDRGNIVLTSEKPSQILLPQYSDTCPFGNDK